MMIGLRSEGESCSSEESANSADEAPTTPQRGRRVERSFNDNTPRLSPYQSHVSQRPKPQTDSQLCAGLNPGG